MDVVIPLSDGSHNDDFELKYLLRSLCTHFKIFDHLWLITTHIPDWLNTDAYGCHVVAIEDKYPADNQDKNMIWKIHQLLENNRVSDQFLRCSDDQALLLPYEHKLMTFYLVHGPFHTGEILQSLENEPRLPDGRPLIGFWRNRLLHTRAYMHANGRPTFNYETHMPVIYRAYDFLNMANEVPYQNAYPTPAHPEGEGFTINSLYFNYANYVGYSGTFLGMHPDIRASIQIPMEYYQIKDACRGKLFLSYNEAALNRDLKRYLKIQFPDESKFEK